MTGSDGVEGERAQCPFCAAEWTDAMLTQFDRFTMPSACACCGGAPSLHEAVETPPPEDINCAACGKAIYRGFAANKGINL